MQTNKPYLKKLQMRHKALKTLRGFFEQQNFLEVETPILVPGPGLEVHIDPFKVKVTTNFQGEKHLRYLHTSPELALKIVLSKGAKKIYQVARVFRDGEGGKQHLPEFTMIEWYRSGATLDDLAADCLELFNAIAQTLEITPLWLTKPLQSVSVRDLFFEYTQIDLDHILVQMQRGDALALVTAAKEKGFDFRENADFEDAFFCIMDTVESHLPRDQALLVSRWPAQMAVLANLCADNPLYAQRFEIYVNGLELCNAFDELTDSKEQRERFAADNTARQALGKETLPIDEDFLEALKTMPPAVGIALGWERTLMALFETDLIDEVQAFKWR